MKPEILTVDSDRWDEFVDLFGEATEDDIPVCSGPDNRARTRRVLTEMGGIDIERTLILFAAQGGGCDCEILFNVICAAEDESND